jgi:hypothetical protein
LLILATEEPPSIQFIFEYTYIVNSLGLQPPKEVPTMPDPAAAQNLYDALNAFVGSGQTKPVWYGVAKDFQTITAAIITLMSGLVAAWLAYRGEMKRMDFERESANVDRQRRQ